MSEDGTVKRARRSKMSALTVNDDGVRLRPFVDRIVALEQERRDLAADIKKIYADVAGAEFMPKAVREIVKHEMQDAEQRAAREALESEVMRLERALGAFVTTPLGDYAMASATRQ